MFETLKSMVGMNKIDFAQLAKDGAIILDVRTPTEYSGGHIENSINIAVDQLKINFRKIKDKEKTIITCCASGMRSGSAKYILQSNGYVNVHNGGSWQELNQKINQS
ncbi:MAG: rhodanese-like domain-containing protein [Cyclobacteriaceae bacterium]|jgi:phage shock protein E|nr:rhodanese-like domain-containing protein [Cyclobacteriaceae bacterium]